MTIPWLRSNFLARRRLDRWFLDAPDALLRRFQGRAHWPPYSLRAFVGNPSDFDSAGRWFVEDLRELGLLPGGTRILDLGCGSGRVALALAAANLDVTYEGIDVDRDCVTWCERHLTPRHPRFQFRHSDAPNPSYNPRGGATAALLPYPDASFDLMLATSVFTHLLPADLERCLHEAGRVLAPGGTLYASAFLLDDGSPARHGIAFPVRHDGYALHRADFPTNAVAYDPDRFLGLASAAGLTLRSPIRFGVQDLMLLGREIY